LAVNVVGWGLWTSVAYAWRGRIALATNVETAKNLMKFLSIV